MKKTIITGAVLAALGLGVYVSGLHIIPPGTAGIVYRANGGVSDKLLLRGWRWSAPIVTNVELYSTSMETSYMCATERGDSKGDESFAIMTADGKEVIVDLEFSYKFDIDNLAKVYEYHKGKDGEEIKETFIKQKIITVVNNVSTQFNVFDIYGSQRPQLNDEITLAAREYFAEYGILVDRVSVTRVEPDEATKAAIQAKVDKLQELEIAKTNKEIAEQEADKKVIEAQGEADAAIIKAQGEKESNELKQQSLTDKLLQQQWIEKWSGNLPEVMGGEGMSTIINMDNVE